MQTAMLDSLIRRQKAELEKQKEVSRQKIIEGKEPTKTFSLKRQDSLLRAPDAPAKDWFFCVPPYFNDALDIRLIERVQVKNKKVVRSYLEWSQSSLFAFSAGDVIYDAILEGTRSWSECVKAVNVCLQVTKASSADLLGEGDEAYRFPGNIECAVLTPDENHQKLIKRGELFMTQDEFVRVLIAGPNDAMRSLINTHNIVFNLQEIALMS